MRNLAWTGVLLIFIGIGGLIMQNATFTETNNVFNVGPLELRTQEQHQIPIATIAAVVAVIGGLGLLFASERSVRS